MDLLGVSTELLPTDPLKMPGSDWAEPSSDGEGRKRRRLVEVLGHDGEADPLAASALAASAAEEALAHIDAAHALDPAQAAFSFYSSDFPAPASEPALALPEPAAATVPEPAAAPAAAAPPPVAASPPPAPATPPPAGSPQHLKPTRLLGKYSLEEDRRIILFAVERMDPSRPEAAPTDGRSWQDVFNLPEAAAINPGRHQAYIYPRFTNHLAQHPLFRETAAARFGERGAAAVDAYIATLRREWERQQREKDRLRAERAAIKCRQAREQAAMLQQQQLAAAAAAGVAALPGSTSDGSRTGELPGEPPYEEGETDALMNYIVHYLQPGTFDCVEGVTWNALFRGVIQHGLVTNRTLESVESHVRWLKANGMLAQRERERHPPAEAPVVAASPPRTPSPALAPAAPRPAPSPADTSSRGMGPTDPSQAQAEGETPYAPAESDALCSFMMLYTKRKTHVPVVGCSWGALLVSAHKSNVVPGRSLESLRIHFDYLRASGMFAQRLAARDRAGKIKGVARTSVSSAAAAAAAHAAQAARPP